MMAVSPRSRLLASLLILALGSLAPAARAHADDKGDQGPAIPACDSKIGTLAIHEPENKWWLQYNLESPEALLKVYVQQSKCFTLVDRGKGLEMAKEERALSSDGEMRQGSNIGKGQMKAADYVLVPDIANKNANAGGKRFGGILGGRIGGGIGAVLGGVNLKSKTADVVLTLTDVRSTEEVAVVQGHAKKTDLGWGAGGGGFFGAFAAGGVSSYSNTEIGQVVAMAYLDAYKKLLVELQKNTPNAQKDNTQQAVKMAKAGKLYAKADLGSEVVRDLDPGITLYPTGEKYGVWWKVTDELGHEGWVNSTLLELAK